MGGDPVHGTRQGWMAHIAAKEKNCPECQKFMTVYQRAWRFRTGRQHDLVRCHLCGSVFKDQHLCAMA